jgi:hypothetical protein
MKEIMYISLMSVSTLTFIGCKKEGCTDPTATNYNEKAKKDDGSCTYTQNPEYTIPATYAFVDANGNNTVDYSGQTERLVQLAEMVVLMKTGTSAPVSAQALKDMFANTNGNGNGNFSFSSTKQLKDKCFEFDRTQFEDWMDSLAKASLSYNQTASNGQAGKLTTGDGKSYLFDDKGYEHVQLIEKGIMGAVFMHQAINVYFGSGKMDVDNSIAVDAAGGKYYTAMEHHFDEAFGYFGVDVTFPAIIPDNFWGKYSQTTNNVINSNNDMMNNFKKGRAAITAKVYADRDQAITAIRKEWEEISAFTARKYLNDAVASFGSDNAKFLHVLSEAYAFLWNLRYCPLETRRFTATEHANLMSLFPANLWDMTISDINALISAIDAKY